MLESSDHSVELRLKKVEDDVQDLLSVCKHMTSNNAELIKKQNEQLIRLTQKVNKIESQLRRWEDDGK